MRARYDIVVIGSGAGGATLAHQLAAGGKSILILERGERLQREAQNWDSNAVFGKSRYTTNEQWRDRRGKTFTPMTHYNVGGNTKVYGAALFRLRESDFKHRQHVDGVSPAWPLAYADFAPYYLKAERLYKVHGERGADPTEPPESSAYAHPSLPHEAAIAELDEDLRRIGAHPFPLPLALHVDTAKPERSACIRCGTCDGFPCLLNAKSDAQVTCIDPALEYPNVEMLTGAYVQRLETSGDGGSVRRVHVVHKGAPLIIEADIVVVACGAINSAALLLHSASDRHPQGLANGSGQLGRNYMCHVNSVFMALSPRRNPTRFQKTLGLNDFYDENRDGTAPLGHVQMLGKIDSGVLAAQAAWAPTALLRQVAAHSLDFWLMSEDLPSADNRVQVDTDGRIRLSYTPNNLAAHRGLNRRWRDLLTRSDRRKKTWLPRRAFVSQRVPLAGVSHQCGTARFGADAQASVLNLECRAHEVDNLYVVDGSFFPSIGAVNPTLTIIANALRIGDIIAARLA